MEKWKLYTTNEAGWEAMLEACKSAKESIDLEQFLFVRNDIGEKFINVCAQKSQEGVKVRFLWDAVGSFSFFGSESVDELHKRGIELIFFKTVFPSLYEAHNYKSWYFRNHRRTLVVDRKIGFTGSICVSDEMRDWRDTVVRIEGKVVKEMQNAFKRMWCRAQKKKIPNEFIGLNAGGGREFKYVTNNPMPGKRHLYKSVLSAIRDAREYVYITTPYFVPTRKLESLLKKAAKNGIRIKILIPEYTDHPIVDLCSRTFFNALLKAGVKIYLYKGEMTKKAGEEKGYEIIHSKTIIVDGKWSSIGTLNMDTISLLHNFEANIVSTNRDFAEELLTHFIDDTHKAREITYAEWKSRYWIEKFTGFFVRFVRDFL